MDAKDDAAYIKLPASVFFMLVASIGLGGAGTYGVLGPPGSHTQTADFIKDIHDVRETAQAALSLAAQVGRQANDNREFILERTRDRYTSDQATKDWREQNERDEQHERRLMSIERELDKLRK